MVTINFLQTQKSWVDAQFNELNLKHEERIHYEDLLEEEKPTSFLTLIRNPFNTLNSAIVNLNDHQVCLTTTLKDTIGWKFQSKALLIDKHAKKMFKVFFLLTRGRDSGKEIELWNQIVEEWSKYIKSYALIRMEDYQKSLIIQERFRYDGYSFRKNKINHVSRIKLIGMMAQLAEQVDYLHSHKIRHRDIKIENVLLQEKEGKWTAVLVDFGAASTEEEIEPYKQTTYCSWSPEIWISYVREKDKNIPNLYSRDIWALGLVFASFLYPKIETGANTLNETKLDKTMWHIIHGNNQEEHLAFLLDFMRKALPFTSEDLVGTAITGMLAFKQEDRPNSTAVLSIFKSFLV